MDKNHIIFLSVFLIIVTIIFFLFGGGSVDGFDTIDIPLSGIPPQHVKVVKKNPDGSTMRDAAGNIVYGMVKIPAGYYAVSKKNATGNDLFIEGSTTDKDFEFKKVPYGYMASPDRKSITASTQAAQFASYQKDLSASTDTGVFTGSQTEERNYNPLDISEGAYHDTPGNLGKFYFYDAEGKLVVSDVSGTNISPVIYYIPGSYKYGASNYVPNYEDSVYMSRTTRQSTVTPVFNTSSILGGFCAQHKGDNLKIEEKCNALDVAACASTSCCVLLGGQKCVAGSANGPTNPANYSDFRVVNKDVYYYEGKCYGNCV
jgi:hypothetical protein